MASRLVCFRVTLPTLPVLGCVAMALLGVACHTGRGSRAVQPKPDSVDVGYDTRPIRDVTGSVSRVQTEEERRTTATTLAELLVAKVPGLDVSRRGGRMIARVRGQGSNTNSGYALIIVDGMTFSDVGVLPDINPRLVTEISVLKDESSTAIYGSRGGNGVILISTKRKH